MACQPLPSKYCIVPRCSVTFWTHTQESFPVGQFFRRWIRRTRSFRLIDCLIDDKLTLTWLVYWIRTARPFLTGAGPNRRCPMWSGTNGEEDFHDTVPWSTVGCVFFQPGTEREMASAEEAKKMWFELVIWSVRSKEVTTRLRLSPLDSNYFQIIFSLLSACSTFK